MELIIKFRLIAFRIDNQKINCNFLFYFFTVAQDLIVAVLTREGHHEVTHDQDLNRVNEKEAQEAVPEAKKAHEAVQETTNL